MIASAVGPDGEHEILLIEDHREPPLRIYELRHALEPERSVSLLGGELEALFEWWKTVEWDRRTNRAFLYASDEGTRGEVLTRVDDQGSAPRLVRRDSPSLTLQLLGDGSFDGQMGHFDIHIRSENGEWVADAYDSRIESSDLAWVTSLAADSLDALIELLVRTLAPSPSPSPR